MLVTVSIRFAPSSCNNHQTHHLSLRPLVLNNGYLLTLATKEVFPLPDVPTKSADFPFGRPRRRFPPPSVVGDIMDCMVSVRITANRKVITAVSATPSEGICHVCAIQVSTACKGPRNTTGKRRVVLAKNSMATFTPYELVG